MPGHRREVGEQEGLPLPSALPLTASQDMPSNGVTGATALPWPLRTRLHSAGQSADPSSTSAVKTCNKNARQLHACPFRRAHRHSQHVAA